MAAISVQPPTHYGDGVTVSTNAVRPRQLIRSDSADPQLPLKFTTSIIQPPTEQAGGIGGAGTGSGGGSATYWITG